MKTKFFVSPIGRPLFYKEKKNSEKLVAWLICLGGLYFVVRIIWGAI